MPKNLTESCYSYSQVSSLWLAIHLAVRKKRVLLSIGPGVTAVLANSITALKSISWKRELPEFFKPPDGRNEATLHLWKNSVNACEDYCGSKSYELFLLKRGIVAHYGQLATYCSPIVHRTYKKRHRKDRDCNINSFRGG